MKKLALFLAAALTIGLFVSCSDDDDDDTVVNNGGGENTNPDDSGDGSGDGSGDDTGGTTTSAPITIDGDFADWDALITEEADEAEVVYVKDPDEDYNTIRNLKITSDHDYIYFYVEIANEALYWESNLHRSNSMTGFGGTTHGPLWIYIDSDNDNHTGLYPNRHPFGTGDYNFNRLSDNVIQLYTWADPDTKVWDMSWSQILMQCAEDYGCWDDAEKLTEGSTSAPATQDGWPATTWCPDGQGWAPDLDNYFVDFDDWAGVVYDDWCKCEFRMLREGFFTNYGEDRIRLEGDANGCINIGLANQLDIPKKAYNWTRDLSLDTTPHQYMTDGVVSGIIPGDGMPVTLKLAD